jgi:hypothetical protein
VNFPREKRWLKRGPTVKTTSDKSSPALAPMVAMKLAVAVAAA